ncbi:MAG: hypothetical protein WCX27_00535 [Candidatus Paceibacterota bacterium]|jgi:hypothetical protein
MAIALFYTSLVLIIAMISVKYFGISIFRHEVISNIVCENDEHCRRIVGKSRHIASKIKFENFHKLSVMVANYIKTETIQLKRRLDSQQPKFFLKQQKTDGTHKHSVSFFLKNVSDYKDSLRRKDL